MPLSFYMPVIIYCLGTAQPELMLDSTAGQACQDAGTDSRLHGNKAQEREYVPIYINTTYDTRHWEACWNQDGWHRYVEEVTVQSDKEEARAICTGEWKQITIKNQIPSISN